MEIFLSLEIHRLTFLEKSFLWRAWLVRYVYEQWRLFLAISCSHWWSSFLLHWFSVRALHRLYSFSILNYLFYFYSRFILCSNFPCLLSSVLRIFFSFFFLLYLMSSLLEFPFYYFLFFLFVNLISFLWFSRFYRYFIAWNLPCLSFISDQRFVTVTFLKSNWLQCAIIGYPRVHRT